MEQKHRILNFLASLRLAVMVILVLAVVAGAGTIIEAQYDAQVAAKLVYRAWPMQLALGLLSLNLIGVMVHRWPWKRHHSSFVLAHVGILVILFGAWLTQRWGLDGNIAFGIGETQRFVTVDETELSLFVGNQNSPPQTVWSQPVDFFLDPPSPERPFRVQKGEFDFSIIDYAHYGIRKSEFQASDKVWAVPAIRLHLKNDRLNLTQWVKMDEGEGLGEINFGPARVILASQKMSAVDGNVLVIVPEKTGDLHYQLFTKRDPKKVRTGRVKEGGTFDTGWMGIQISILRYLPRAEELVTYQKRERPTPMTRPAILIENQGRRQWISQNAYWRSKVQGQTVFLAFGQRRVDLGFPLTLKKFEVGHYQGTNRASSYESLVEVPELGESKISMNEPLKYGGLTFYQASFEQNEKGEPVASILSVNRDPGRPLKYLGSLMIVLGTILLFYFRGLGRKRGAT